MEHAAGDAAVGDAVCDGSAEAGEAVDAGPLLGFTSMLPPAAPQRFRSGDTSEGPSESSTCRSGANVGDDTEEDDFQATIPHLERFYEQLAAKAKLPERNGAATQNWVLSLARSYRRLSKEKRRRGGLRALLQPAAQGGFSAASGSGLPCSMEQPGFSSTDDSGYEAGYETDADESELSEWETASASQRQQRHKRKLDALVHLTMKLSFAEHGMEEEEDPASYGLQPPPLKQQRALGTQPVGMRLPLSNSVQSPPPAPPFAWPLKPLSSLSEPSGSHAGGAAAVGAVTGMNGTTSAALLRPCFSVGQASSAGAGQRAGMDVG